MREMMPPVETAKILEGEEREKFTADLSDYIAGLEAALADPELPEDQRAELEAELEGLKDSQDAIADGGEIKTGI